jgi:hypothetical protein
MLLILLKYITPKRQHINLYLFFILGHTACLHQQLKTLLALLEPLLDLVDILDEIHLW